MICFRCVRGVFKLTYEKLKLSFKKISDFATDLSSTYEIISIAVVMGLGEWLKLNSEYEKE